MLFALLLTGCDGLDCVEAEGPVETAQRDHKNFTRVETRGSYELFVQQDSAYSVAVRTRSAFLPEIETSVSDGKLTIDQDGCLQNHDRIEVFITMPTVEALTMKGSGNIRSDSLNVGDLELKIKGSGDIWLQQLSGQALTVRIEGSGDSQIAGEVDSQKLRVKGSGDLQHKDLRSRTCDIHTQGSGDATVWVTEALEVLIEGSGSVSYRGSPSIESEIKGSGDISQR
jgi:hypothetical protein